ncbi:MAG: D-glycero-beta-D-manno-heptose-7-phosphate kinase [Planctomycetes bacterium]|nr:D-glycero-beta-D-manno-heptose-7-phosphate kinase [Planctomycetota bacterium]
MDTLIDVINRFKRPYVLVVGDLILDRYTWGKAGRISPEAPFQILDFQAEKLHVGGAANVAHNLITLGAKVICLGAVGDDENGKLFKNKLKAIGINTRLVITEKHRVTTVKNRFVDSTHKRQVLRVDTEKAEPISKTTEQIIIKHLRANIKNADLVVASDYCKGVLTDSLMKFLCRLCRQHHKKLLIGPKGKDYSKYKGSTAITPNRLEAEMASGIEIKDAKSLKEAAKKLITTLNLEFVVITRGEHGIYLLSRKGQEIEGRTKSLSVYDVTGAGDTVLATLCISLVSGLNYAQSIHLANLAAGVVVGKLGTATVSKDEIIEHYSKHTFTPPAIKIKTLDEIINMRKAFPDKHIVFTNGCFDILHPGHIKSLNFARAQGDILVVGLNSDKSVRLIKGKGRPIFNQELRSHSIASLESVDYIVIFDEPTPYKLISNIKPNILVKGIDWKGKKVVGEDIIKSTGGKIVFAPLEKGISTTKIIQKLS